MTALRPDRPILYHFERPHDSKIDAIRVVIIQKIYYLLWVMALLLVAIAFPSVRVYMAIAAGTMLAFLLLYGWATRKVGKEP